MTEIELKGIYKSFGSVAANKNVCLTVEKGEIHALLGENGSGKSTLVNMLSGIYRPDRGDILLRGERQEFASPKEAITAGIGMVHQHFKLVEVFTALENIVAGTKLGAVVRQRDLSQQITALAKQFGLGVDPNKKIYNMSVGEKQTVEILKVLYRGARVLILDEPTAVLTPQEVKTLFDILRNMKREGCSIIIITHKLGEVMELSDRVTVLRRGESIQTVETAKTSPVQLTEMMVGRAVNLDVERVEAKRSDVAVLQVDQLSCRDVTHAQKLNSVTFSLHAGEILGVAGIAGSGQKELCDAIAGLQRATGSILLDQQELLGLSPREIMAKGISMSFVPEDRLGMGLVAGMDVVDNMLLKSYRSKKGFLVDRGQGREIASEVVERFDISTPSIHHIVRKLSGGNIQKVLLGREVRITPKLLITAYPVRGLDIGASMQVYGVINEQKQAGAAVLFIAEDLDILMGISDRLLVLHGGEVMGIVNPQAVTREQVGLMMLGKSHGEEAALDA